MLKRSILALLAGLALFTLPAAAATYYVAPIGAVIPALPDGTRDKPFASTDTALQSGKLKGGDIVLLMDGVHPALRISTTFASPITFKSENGRRARVDSISLSSLAKNIVIQDLKVWSDKPISNFSPLVSTAQTTSDIEFIRLDVRGGEKAYDYLTWSATDWKMKAPSGIFLTGPRQSVRHSTFTGVYFGIVLGGSETSAVANRVDGFAGDGMRGFGPNNSFRDNEIVNCVSIDGNHADGFQSFSSGSIIGITLERNRFIEWTHDPNHPLRCALQGIGLFEGLYENFRIVNNVVAGRLGHGITIYGGKNVQIINNTVVHIDGDQPGWPWIGVFPSKTGRASENVLVVNNLAMGYQGASDATHNIVFKANRIVRSVAVAFPAWRKFDYMLRPDSRFAGKALMAYAPELDVLRNVRPINGPRDLGAYEVGDLAGLADPNSGPPPAISAAADAAELAGASATSADTTTAGGAKFIAAP